MEPTLIKSESKLCSQTQKVCVCETACAGRSGQELGSQQQRAVAHTTHLLRLCTDSESENTSSARLSLRPGSRLLLLLPLVPAGKASVVKKVNPPNIVGWGTWKEAEQGPQTFLLSDTTKPIFAEPMCLIAAASCYQEPIRSDSHPVIGIATALATI